MDLPDPGIEPISLASPTQKADSLPLGPPGEPHVCLYVCTFIHTNTHIHHHKQVSWWHGEDSTVLSQPVCDKSYSELSWFWWSSPIFLPPLPWSLSATSVDSGEQFWLRVAPATGAVTVGVWDAFEETSEKQTADPNRHLRQNGAPECGQGPRQQCCRGEGLSTILHIQERPDSRGIYEGLTISTASKQHLVNIWLQGTELVGFLQDESSTPDRMWGVCVGGKYLNTHGNVSVKEILKLRKQRLAREYWL